MFICKYCNQEFETKQKLGGHVSRCKSNPNYEKNLQQLAAARTHIKYNIIDYTCQYCGKHINNKGCLVIHEKACAQNPNREKCINRIGNGGHLNGHNAWNKGLTKDTSEIIKNRSVLLKEKYENGELTPAFLNKHHTEETKQIISEKRKLWLLEHKDEHVWKRNEKFISKPCENLKSFLKENGIKFIEEYEPFNDVNYCVDIAFPDKKIAIEVNGNQHYNKDGSLKDYYQKRHDLFVERGWKIFEIHYTKCYNIDINYFKNIIY